LVRGPLRGRVGSKQEGDERRKEDGTARARKGVDVVLLGKIGTPEKKKMREWKVPHFFA